MRNPMTDTLGAQQRPGTAISLLFCAIFALSVTSLFAQEMDLGVEPELEQTRYRVDGTVRGPAGPAEGVTVHLEVSDMRIRRQVGYLQTHTDTEGMFTFDLSEYDFPQLGLEFYTVSPRFIEGLKIEVVNREDLPLSLELNLQPGTMARGTVHDTEGNPLPEVYIQAPGIRPQQSDEDGDWECFGIPPGFTRLQFTKDGYATEQLEIRSQEPEVLEGFEITMKSSRQLIGRVVNWGGQPVPEALVTFEYRDRGKNAVTNEEGVARIVGIPAVIEEGAAEVLLQAKGYLPTRLPLDPNEIGERPIDWTIDRGVSLAGTVKLPDGTPAAGSIIMAGEEAAGAPQAQASADGTWEIGPFPPGEELILTALPPSFEPTWSIADLVVQPSAESNKYKGNVELWPKGFSSTFAIEYDGTTMRMRRYDKGDHGFGAPINYEAPWDGASGYLEGTLEVVGMMQSGNFTLRQRSSFGEGLAGEWELREEIGASELKVAPVQEVVQLPFITGLANMDFKLDVAQELSGQVLTEDGHPFIDGYVFLTRWNDTDVFTPRAEIEAAGRFHFNRVPQGVFYLIAYDEEQANSAGPFPARGGVNDLQLIAGDDGEHDPLDD
ncbi:carboxypeptidase-like regulatory domain-containing protein [bacterium]|nr:carboxypeptidase-like regulatory domain-containing protein [bacterium]